ncbi:MAG TPA: PrsW family glutamic-type intramembrane protease [Ktedonobacteraceae bacterium]|nr:PrsW family glutamic-type intramembrane protease [Ktedonobacteraceae bacterium]
MGYEYMGPLPDPDAQQNQPLTETNADPASDKDATQPRRAIAVPPVVPGPTEQYQEPSYQEHAWGQGALPPMTPYYRPAPQPYGMSPQAPAQQPQNGHPAQQPYPSNGAYPYGSYPVPYPYAPYQQYQGYYGYPPYGYPYPMQPPVPRRNGYQLGVSIAAFIGAILVFLAGLGCVLLLLLLSIVPPTAGTPQDQIFSASATFTAFAVAGVVGGGFSLYHSVRALFLNRPSAQFKLPWFWIFLVLYVVLLLMAAALNYNDLPTSNAPAGIFLIALAGLLPALTVLSLALRRLHFPSNAKWPTSWRRFTLAVVSGATIAVVLAGIFELILTAIAIQQSGITSFSIDNPDLPIPQDPRAIALLLVIVSVIAPLVEEAVKPLAVVVLIGRIQSAAEAFILGLACGIGFDLIETSGYISMGNHDWITVAIERSSAGLLHGFGAGMVALGWYFMTHRKSVPHNVLLAFGCWGYAVLQHATWNGSFLLQLLPAPIGPYLDNAQITLGNIAMPASIIIYVVETTLMLLFFFFVTGKLRGKKRPPKASLEASKSQQLNEMSAVART